MIGKRMSLLAAVFAVSIAMTAQEKNNIAMMEEAIERFVGSGQLLIKDTHWSHAHEQWHFKLTKEGDTLIEPQALTQLEDVFAKCAGHSTFAYLCDEGKGSMHPWEIQFHRQDNFYGGIYGQCRVDNSQNIRIVSLDDDGRQVFYGLKWAIVPFYDRYGKSWHTLEGVVFAFKEGIWNVDVKQRDRQLNAEDSYYLNSLNYDDQLKYATLMAQMHRLNELTGSDRTMQADLYLYMLTKLFDEFKGQLTERQYEDVIKQIYPFSKNKLSTAQERILSKAVVDLQLHVRLLPTENFHVSDFLSNSGSFVNPEQKRIVDLNYDLKRMNPAKVSVKLTGTAAGMITITPCFPHLQPYRLLADSGRFSLVETFLESQFLEIRDRQGNQLVIIADSIPTEVNLHDMTIIGSTQNERFAEAQRRLKSLEPELRKYAIRDADGDYTVIDVDGYNRLLADVHQLQLQLMDENVDLSTKGRSPDKNMIPVWYLSTNFTTMTYDELSRYLRHDLPYTNHVALQPVWQYYEGLSLRQPGRLFSNAECIDTAGVVHQLSEYIGKGDYVVLQFWEERNWTAHSGCKLMKKMARDYQGKNIRFIGFSLDASKDRWKNYIKKRDLDYEHLTAPDKSNSRLWNCEAAKVYGIMTLPETIIFAPDGRIVSTGLAGDSLMQFVRTLPLK